MKFKDMVVRSSNANKSSDKDLKLMVFILLDNTVFCYVHGLPDQKTGLSLRFVTQTSSPKFEQISNS